MQDILYFVNQMFNLRSLTILCSFARKNLLLLEAARNDLIEWLKHHLPSTCTITIENASFAFYYIHLWIR